MCRRTPWPPPSKLRDKKASHKLVALLFHWALKYFCETWDSWKYMVMLWSISHGSQVYCCIIPRVECLGRNTGAGRKHWLVMLDNLVKVNWDMVRQTSGSFQLNDHNTLWDLLSCKLSDGGASMAARFAYLMGQEHGLFNWQLTLDRMFCCYCYLATSETDINDKSLSMRHQ
jgi:hypothetical protein